MRFLVINDDGIDAPGLAALEQVLARFGQFVTVAPAAHLSGCSHRATTDRALEVAEVSPGRYRLDGLPVDCVRIGLKHLGLAFDWVVAGINAGGNLGHDVHLSGTVAAAREAAILHTPAIAISQFVRRRWPIDWQPAAVWSSEVVRQLLSETLEPGEFWNVNLPDCETPLAPPPRLVRCRLDPQPLPVRYQVEEGKLRYRASYQERGRTPGHDVDVCFSGDIAISRLRAF